MSCFGLGDKMKKIIFDFGANNGDDIPYYLKKADLVVAVEANPVLAALITDRFPKEIASGRLIVENCVLNCDEATGEVAFYIHTSNHVLSQFPRPDEALLADFEMVFLPSRTPLDIIKTHGEPYYIKIDIEYYDHVVLEHLFANKIFPPYISAEFHSVDVFCLLISLGKYKSFKIVDGASVAQEFINVRVRTASGDEETISFPHHAAGPFGEDIAGGWMNSQNAFCRLGLEGTGWKDIHASRIDEPDENAAVTLGSVAKMAAYLKLRSRFRFLTRLHREFKRTN